LSVGVEEVVADWRQQQHSGMTYKKFIFHFKKNGVYINNVSAVMAGR